MTPEASAPLYDGARHEDLKEIAWNPATVESEIADIVSETERAQRSDGGWPLHPLDAESYRIKTTKWALYSGAAGVIIGLQILRARGHGPVDHRARLPDIHRRYLQSPDIEPAEPGLQLGELGILTPWILAAPDDSEAAGRLETCMAAILQHEALEITSGQTGMMHAAMALFEATGERRWLDWYRRGAEALWDAWQPDSEGLGWLWRSRLFGETRRYFGACHGLAGNVGALLRGAAFLPPAHLPVLQARTAATLERSARRRGDQANWFVSAPPVAGKLMVQWCHGAAGIVTALREMPGDRTAGPARAIDRLLRQAATLTWHAGPLAKGSGLCHGTSGNGLAFLAMYSRTGEHLWLTRARAFAMHAIRQSRSAHDRYRQRRFSLMTGDLGLAVYLSYCLNPDDIRYPGLERFS